MSITWSSHAWSGFAAGEGQRERDVLERGERGDEVVGLEDEADLVAAQIVSCLSLKVARSSVADEDLAGGERVEPGEAVHERRLARAGRAHDGREPAVLEVDGDAVEGAHLGVAGAVDLDGVDALRRSDGGGVRSGGVMPR